MYTLNKSACQRGDRAAVVRGGSLVGEGTYPRGQRQQWRPPTTTMTDHCRAQIHSPLRFPPRGQKTYQTFNWMWSKRTRLMQPISALTLANLSPSSRLMTFSVFMSDLLPSNMMTTSSWAYSYISPSHACQEPETSMFRKAWSKSDAGILLLRVLTEEHEWCHALLFFWKADRLL